ncbi:MAG TPA: tetratricopeptide repeat protein, partial [Verrucomicrobiae bacterium]|nr:tetratricopeptide repeat protein [Verrucomicrobiae bacterium]
YHALGKEFAKAFLDAQDGNTAAAASVFRKMAQSGGDDIVLYEAGLAAHRLGNRRESESLLRRARGANPGNPLVPMALVDLLLEEGRLEESIGLLLQMIEAGQMREQASILLGDIRAHQGDETTALDLYTPLLKSALAKEAASRIAAILEKQNRLQEAAAVRKQYLKGCC